MEQSRLGGKKADGEERRRAHNEPADMSQEWQDRQMGHWTFTPKAILSSGALAHNAKNQWTAG